MFWSFLHELAVTQYFLKLTCHFDWHELIVVCDLYSAICNSDFMAKGNCTSHCIEMFDCI